MEIKGIEGMSRGELQHGLSQGARFVMFSYCVSILIMTFKRPSNVYYVRPGESAFAKGVGFTALSLLAGWWGIPWGPIYTIGSVWTNCAGGTDVTQDIRNSLGL